MTNQEAFDIVVKHLLSQGERSLTPGGLCAYRGKNGLKCAVGILIPDNEYSPELEGSLSSVRYKCSSLKSVDFDFLGKLQNIHDDYLPDAWEMGLKELAVNYNLEWKEQNN